MGLFDFLFGKRKDADLSKSVLPNDDKVSLPSNNQHKAIDPERLAKIKAEALAKAAKIKAEKELAAKKIDKTPDQEPKTFSKESLQGIDLGGPFTLVPLDKSIFNSKDFPMIGLMANMTPDLSKWLPGFDLSTPERARTYINACVMRTELGMSFTYLIKMNSGICGMIFVNTPIYNQTTIGFPYWSCDFFLFKPMQGQELMPKILLGLFLFLKNVMKIHNIYSIVDSKNIACINMLNKCLFYKKRDDMIFTDPNTGNQAIAYQSNLESLEDPFSHLR